MKRIIYKLYLSLMIFLLCFSIPSFITLNSTEDKSTNYFDQSHSSLQASYGSDPSTLRVGILAGPHTLDPVDSWDSASYDIIDQVVETLFSYDLNDPELPLINQLAESSFWLNSTALYITLRQEILFHDGTPFNAAAAKWNIDRLLYLTNCTGANYGAVAQTRSLWCFPNTDIPIISHVETFGDRILVINLNAPYGPLPHLLSFINAGMLSPTSTPQNDFLDVYSGHLVATGPFMYDYYNPDVEVRFTRWDYYWKGPAFFEEVQFLIFYDQITAHNALLAGTIDILNSYSDQNLATYEADPKITVKKFTEDTGKPGFEYHYIGINNVKYNQTWRKVMSYAINYTYIIEELRLGNVIRANSPISPVFGAAYNENAKAANYNVTKARNLIQSMGYGTEFTSDQDWINAAEYSPFMTVRYTYNLENSFRTDLGIALTQWFNLIGVAIEDNGVNWDEYLSYLFNIVEPGNPDSGWNHLGLFSLGWAADFLDPSNMLDPLFSNMSSANSAQVNDPTLNNLLTLALETTDETARNNIYKDIQEYIAEVGFFHIPLYHNIVNFVHLTEIQGVPYNALEKLYVYPIYRATPGMLSLYSDAGSPDDDGTFTLYWSSANNTDSYSVYQSSSFIYNLDGNQTQIAGGITDLSLFLTGYTEGTYFFVVAAYNEFGYTISNCIIVIVEMLKEHDLEVYLDIPTGIQYNNTYTITASVRNVGLSDETNVNLLLGIDDILVDSLNVPFLPSGAIYSIYYEWTPTEYKIYNFTVYAPPVYNETSLDNNYINKEVSLLKTQIFGGLLINYLFSQGPYSMETNFSYFPYQNSLFYESWNLYGGGYQWIVDTSTRVMSNMSVFGDGSHTPVWIFTDVNLGDNIPIAVDGEGDHMFNVADELIYDLPGFGLVGVWILEDLTFPGGWAWYEKSTGILLYGTFIYYYGAYNYTLEFFNTNAQFQYVGGPGPFSLSSDAGDPDNDGSFNLFWTESEDANSYSVYQSSSFITEITGELSLIADGIVDLNLALEGYPDGTYYFIVVATNENGNTLSNCIQVNVESKLPPMIMADTIPDESMITYTRASQVIGSFTAYSTSQILYVGFIGEPNPGFALDTTYLFNGDLGIYLSETRLITTNQLEPGVHTLILRVYNSDGLYYDKVLTVTVYRQAQLNLRGEFDYLLYERVKISIVAQAFDIEDQYLLNPIVVEGMVVHIKIVDYNGVIKTEDTMTYNPDGFFHWDSTKTIQKLWATYSKGIYMVQAWIDFPAESYYLGGIDIIEFHIDPPSDEGIDPWFVIGMISLSAIIGVNIIWAILLKRNRRLNRLA